MVKRRSSVRRVRVYRVLDIIKKSRVIVLFTNLVSSKESIIAKLVGTMKSPKIKKDFFEGKMQGNIVNFEDEVVNVL